VSAMFRDSQNQQQILRFAQEDKREQCQATKWCGSPDAAKLCEGASAAAAFARVRVYEDEALVHERFFVIERHAVQVNEGFRIDEDANIAVREDPVALTRLRIEAD